MATLWMLVKMKISKRMNRFISSTLAWSFRIPILFFQIQSNENSDSEGLVESDDDGSFRSIDDLDGTLFVFQLHVFIDVLR